MSRMVRKGIELVMTVFVFCVIFSCNVKAADVITGGGTREEAVEVEFDKEYTTTNSEGWFKVTMPSSVAYVGVGCDEYSYAYVYNNLEDSFEACLLSLDVGDTCYKEELWKDGTSQYYNAIENTTYYFYVSSSIAEVCNFKIISGNLCQTMEEAELLTLNEECEKKFHINKSYRPFETYYKFVAPTTGTYRMQAKSSNGEATYTLQYKNGLEVCSLECDGNNYTSDTFKVSAGITYYLCVTTKKNSTVNFSISNTPVSEIILNANTLEMYSGDQYILEADVKPENAVIRTVSFSSSNSDVASVSEDGWVTAKSAGTTVITATADDGSGKFASCIVNVKPRLVEEVRLNSNNLEFYYGEQNYVELNETIYPENADNKSVTYSSNNLSVADVDKTTGRVAIKGTGTVAITCTANDGSGKSAKCVINIKKKMVTQIDLEYTYLDFDMTEYTRYIDFMVANVYPEDATDKSVFYTSSNPKIAAIDKKTGDITVKSVGTTVLTCMANDGSGVKKTCILQVRASSFAGAKAIVDGIRYKVTSNKWKGGTVSVVGVKDTTQKAYDIPNTVEINGYKYKVEEIEKKAFNKCQKVTKITLGTNIKKIGTQAFYNCKKLKNITIKSKNLKSVGKNSFKNIHSKAKIKVPSSKLKKYKKLLENKGQKKTVKVTKI